MVIFIKEIGCVIEHKAKGDMYTLMELNTMENGLKINNMVKVQKYGLTKLNIQECINMDKNMEKEYFNGKMVHPTKEILITIISKAMEFMFGQVN